MCSLYRVMLNKSIVLWTSGSDILYLYEPSPSIRNKQVNVIIRVIISRMYTHSLRAFMRTDENIMGLALSAFCSIKHCRKCGNVVPRSCYVHLSRTPSGLCGSVQRFDMRRTTVIHTLVMCVTVKVGSASFMLYWCNRVITSSGGVSDASYLREGDLNGWLCRFPRQQ